ncbi:MAG: EpsG family protein [Clostridia bacterium]|nr:EpsG family protein [Clostridia bacterium]
MSDYNTWVYYLALVLCGVGALILNSNQTEYSLIATTKGEKRPKIVYFVTFMIIGYIVFWAAIRNGIVDTAEYIYGYEQMSTKINFSKIFDKDNKAPLFELYQIILKRIGFSWQGFLAITAIISGFCIWFGISRYSDDVPFSCYLFITSMHFYWLFNGIRQFMVAAVLFLCLRMITEKKFWKFMIIVLILYFFHKTVMIMIPIYFIVNMKNWSYGIYACVLATMAVVILFPSQFTALLDDSFEEFNVAEQFAQDDGVNVFRFLVAMVTPTLAFVYKEEMKKTENKYVNVLVNFSLVSAGLYAVGVVTSGIYIGRLPLYTDLFGLITLPYILKRVLPKQTKGVIWVASLLLYFLYFYLQSKDGGIYYTTNWFPAMDAGGAQL